MEHSSEEPKWLSVSEAARRRKTSRQNVSVAMLRGTLRSKEVVLPDGEVRRFTRADWLDEWEARTEENQRRGKKKGEIPIELGGHRGTAVPATV